MRWIQTGGIPANVRGSIDMVSVMDLWGWHCFVEANVFQMLSCMLQL